MSKVTRTQLYQAVAEINNRYNLSDRTYCQFWLRTGLDGYMVVLRANMPYGSIEKGISKGFLPAEDCIYELYCKAVWGDLSDEVSRFSNLVLSNYNRRS